MGRGRRRVRDIKGAAKSARKRKGGDLDVEWTLDER